MARQANSKYGTSTEKQHLINIETLKLRERLNSLYNSLRAKSANADERFDYLWDLKELALLEGKQSVEIPERWLDELEKRVPQNFSSPRH